VTHTRKKDNAVLTIAALDLIDTIPLLVGGLRQHRRGPIPGRPYLRVIAHCPICRIPHSFAWQDTFRPDAVDLVTAPCARSPWAREKIGIALDPDRQAENSRIAAGFTAALRRWRVEARLRNPLAVERVEARSDILERGRFG
jgi:hypothetical protein